MIKRYTQVLVLMGLLLPVGARAQVVDVSLGENSAYFGYAMLVGGQSFGRSEAGLGFLYNDQKNYMLTGSLQVVDEIGSKLPGTEAGVGLKLYGASAANDVLSIAVGGRIRLAIPSMQRLALGATFFYSPDIISFFDVKKFIEFSGRVEYELLPQASLFIGYQQFTGTTKSDVVFDVDKGLRLGGRIEF